MSYICTVIADKNPSERIRNAHLSRAKPFKFFQKKRTLNKFITYKRIKIKYL
jgi:hypothetical protein